MHLVGIGRRETPVQLRSKLSRTSTQASIVNTYNTEDDLPSPSSAVADLCPSVASQELQQLALIGRRVCSWKLTHSEAQRIWTVNEC
jgi:hypothetical protein